MIIHNYRSMISQFFPLQQENNEVRTANLTQDRPVGEFIKMDALPGDSKSSIEKMTHPLGGYDETGSMSPYMIVLLGDQRALDFAEKVLQAPRQRLLDTLGIDDNNKADRHTRLHSELESLTRFYPNNPEFEPKKITLNDQPFIEQEPTKPYFAGQRVITPDFTTYRAEQEKQRNNLLLCKTRDDSVLYFNQTPIIELKRYNDDVFAKETALRAGDNFLNKTQYFTPMVEYLTQFSKEGDILVQNPFETSSDKNTPHLQFIPGDVPLPLFYQNSQVLIDDKYQQVDWHLPTLAVTVDSRQHDWREQTERVQTVCQELLANQHISTTPVLRNLGNGLIKMYLIFKQDGSDLAAETMQRAPGWLESCGIFISNTPKAVTFTTLGAVQYYAPYGVTDKEQLLTSLVHHLINRA
ncbi:hypothetical protein HBD74_004065 [Salmonella enterica]|nr:hypothetical protein [Salmonella enterica]EEU4859574.1 hypothetical protein [Salmonella enterica]EEU4864592.1 hypothetical protein [Salmonella enterica]EEU4874353.1 hypothetical protein [Salmonella enterica]EEU4890407.1 hypothetical protein [Salmonella enterica]